ncbi:hypothetical protein BD310DRAFT_383893 [Dichomitus squalens]|uniref:Uncharacterized protein n=1 Tax=Dichomitus squalens TaxID=114155 RepID=A0A4Q9PY97_9APHY|nr:hypothetical protein BD310DRAFT_383893 [Dichomitus squalens]
MTVTSLASQLFAAICHDFSSSLVALRLSSTSEVERGLPRPVARAVLKTFCRRALPRKPVFCRSYVSKQVFSAGSPPMLALAEAGTRSSRFQDLKVARSAVNPRRQVL